jgi:lantibiotic biosynthesis protein
LHRCDLLAAGALEAHAGGVRTLENLLAVADQQFRAAGVDMARPYVEAGSGLFDDVEFAWGDHRRRGSLSGWPRARGSPRDFLGAAHRIGAGLVETAIWEADRCTWIGVDGPLDPHSPPGGPPACSPIGGHLYSGTAGVALFLAELAMTTGDAALEKTALGAARHAIHAAAREDPAGGLYTGAISAAFGAAYAGALLGDVDVVHAARGIAHTFDPSMAECDLLSGLAGAELALLTLASALGDLPLHGSARAAADTLLSRAQRDEYGLSWPSSANKGKRNLLGFSHGAAGVACALLEAFAATGEGGYRAAALEAFAYERAWFDPLAQNWPTLLGAGTKTTPRQARRLPRINYWCHGAPGAALARIRAYEILALPALEWQACVALDTTAAALEAIEDVRLENFSLCHGLAGMAAILLEGFRALPTARKSWRDLAWRVARAGLEAHASPADWLCGTRAYGAPGLMIGLAGIGMFYLRLYDESVPSVLLVRPGTLAERLAGRSQPAPRSQTAYFS